MSTVESMPMAVSARLHRWLVIVALAAGLIGMHHLIAGPTAGPGGAHQHTMSATAAPPHPATPHTQATTGNEAPAATGESVGPEGSCPGMGGMMGHPCLAVLTTADTLIPTMAILPVATAPGDPPPPLNREFNPILARAPPTSAERLARLGVWRR
jgi:hypothetical protein